MISEDAMRVFLDGVPDHILVVVDEAYAEFAGALGSDYPNCAGMGYDNVLVLRTFSKAYGLAGLRLGYAIGLSILLKH
jgi:histidinol-phosphate aminotransferase